jgi:hypothetical protein
MFVVLYYTVILISCLKYVCGDDIALTTYDCEKKVIDKGSSNSCPQRDQFITSLYYSTKRSFITIQCCKYRTAMKPFEPIIKEDLNFEFPYNIFGLEYFCIRKPFYSGNVYFGCYVDEDERSPTTYAGSKDEDFMGIWSGHLRATEKKYKTG